MFSAGSAGILDRDEIVWIIRSMVVIGHGILLATVWPFWFENTFNGKQLPNRDQAKDSIVDDPEVEPFEKEEEHGWT